MRVSVSISIEINDLHLFQDAINEITIRENRNLSFSNGIVELCRLGFARKRELWTRQTTIDEVNITQKPRPNEEDTPKRNIKKKKK